MQCNKNEYELEIELFNWKLIAGISISVNVWLISIFSIYFLFKWDNWKHRNEMA